MKVLYIEDNEPIPALLYLEDSEPQPIGFSIATQEQFDFYKDNLNRVYLATNSSDNPLNIDYDILGLYKDRNFVAGELLTINYYVDYNPNTIQYDKLAVKETRTYIRNPEGYVLYRILNVSWYLDDGLIGVTKQTVKYYDLLQSMEEGVTKRSNIINQVKADTLMNLIYINQYSITMAEDEARPLLLEQSNNMGLYREGNTQPIKDSLAISTIPLLDYVLVNDTKTIREWILEMI